MSKRPRTIDTGTARILAVEADVDPKTLIRELRDPGKVLGRPRQRANAALVKHGYLPAKKAVT